MIQAVCVDSRDVRKAIMVGEAYEDALRRLAKPAQIREGHQAYVALENEMLTVVDGVMFGLSLEHILGHP